jgi:DNA polymerase-3 subunit epsilon
LQLVVLAPTAEELEAHVQQLEMIERESKGKCLWKRLEVDDVRRLAIDVTGSG